MTGFWGKKWYPFLLVSHFGVQKWSLDEITPYAPTNLQFGILYENSGAFSVSGSDHFLRGKFSTRIPKLFLKIKNPRVFSKKFENSRGKM